MENNIAENSFAPSYPERWEGAKKFPTSFGARIFTQIFYPSKIFFCPRVGVIIFMTLITNGMEGREEARALRGGREEGAGEEGGQEVGVGKEGREGGLKEGVGEEGGQEVGVGEEGRSGGGG